MLENNGQTTSNLEDKKIPSPTNIKSLEGYFEVVNTVPTFTPKTFYDSVKIYNGIFYIFNYKTNTWVNTSSSFAIGTGTSPASNGAQEITVGFRPKLIKIISRLNTATTRSQCFGSATSTSVNQNTCVYHFGANAFENSASDTSFIVNLLDTSGNTASCGVISAISDTSFTINWTNTTEQCNYSYEVFG